MLIPRADVDANAAEERTADEAGCGTRVHLEVAETAGHFQKGLALCEGLRVDLEHRNLAKRELVVNPHASDLVAINAYVFEFEVTNVQRESNGFREAFDILTWKTSMVVKARATELIM